MVAQGEEMVVLEKVRAIGGSAVVVFSESDCCFCHVVKTLLYGLGVGPTVIELDSEKEIKAVLYHLSMLGEAKQSTLPAIFIGGKFLGGVESLITCHIKGSLVPLLKEAGALWL